MGRRLRREEIVTIQVLAEGGRSHYQTDLFIAKRYGREAEVGVA